MAAVASAAYGAVFVAACALAAAAAAAELASRLHCLLSLAADPSPLSELSARLSVVGCCLAEQEEQQHEQQQQQQQRQQQRWEQERGLLGEEDLIEFSPEQIALSLHQKLLPCKHLVDKLPEVRVALSQAKDRFADVRTNPKP